MGMGVDLTPAQRREIERVVRARRGVLVDTPDGPVIDVFEPTRLAQALEDELARCVAHGWVQITLRMDVSDAVLLARFLRAARTV